MSYKIALLVAMLGALLNRSPAQDFNKYPYTEWDRISARLDDLIYRRQDFDSALALLRDGYTVELRKFWTGRQSSADAYIDRFENYAILIENYRDDAGQPLKLYFQARAVDNQLPLLRGRLYSADGSLSPTGVEQIEETIRQQGDHYRKLISDYPSCKLAAFCCYLLAMHYDQSSDIYFRDRSDPHPQDYGPALRDTLTNLYDRIKRDYPDSVFPTTEWERDGSYLCRGGFRIAPIAQLKIAHLWDRNRGRFSSQRDPSRAIQEYQNLIDNFPGAVDTDSTLLAVKACWAQLRIYTDKHAYRGEYYNLAKARVVCQELLDDFPNQRINFPGAYASIETQPAAYLKLAEIESDIPTALNYYEKVIYGFPGSYAGDEDGVMDYAAVALNELIQNLDNAELSIAECKKVLASPLPVRIRASAQWGLANIYLDDLKDQARGIQELQRLVDEFGDVPTYYKGTFGEWATEAIQGIQRRTDK